MDLPLLSLVLFLRSYRSSDSGYYKFQMARFEIVLMTTNAFYCGLTSGWAQKHAAAFDEKRFSLLTSATTAELLHHTGVVTAST